MKLLALDTSTEACSTAVLIDDEVIERYEVAPRRHAALILPMVEAVLAEAGVGIHDLDGLAYGRGPGAFTGVRIAAGVVQGIAFAADLPVAPVSTLAAIALQIMSEHGIARVAVAVDARMGEVYWGAYRANPETKVFIVSAERVCPPGNVPALDGLEWFGAGSGWSAYDQELSRRLGIETWWEDCYPRAGEIAVLGSQAFLKGEGVAPELALPVYLRDDVARRGPVIMAAEGPSAG